MDQLSKQDYIAKLQDSSWQDIKEEAEKYDIVKSDDYTWKEMVPQIADAKYVEAEKADPDLVDEPKVIMKFQDEFPEEVESNVSYDYVTVAGTRICPVCNYPVRTDLDLKTLICPVSDPICPREVN